MTYSNNLDLPPGTDKKEFNKIMEFINESVSNGLYDQAR